MIYAADLVEMNDTSVVDTIALKGGPISLNGWVVASPEATIDEFVDATRDGGEVTNQTLRNVVETIPITVVSSTDAAVQTALDELNAMLERGAQYARTRTLRGVYLRVQRTSTARVVRSQVVGYRPVALTGDPLGLDMAAVGAQAVITLTRRFYWEGAEVELALASGGIPSTTGGVIIHNCDDHEAGFSSVISEQNIPSTIGASACSGTLPYVPVEPGTFYLVAVTKPSNVNGSVDDEANGFMLGGIAGTINYTTGEWTWAGGTATEGYADLTGFRARWWVSVTRSNHVEIAAADVAGSLPAAVRLTMERTDELGNFVDMVIVGGMHDVDAGNFTSVMEFEDFSQAGVTDWSIESDIYSSDGNYVGATWTGDDWVLLGAKVKIFSYFGNKMFRPVIRLAERPVAVAGAKVKLSVMVYNSIKVDTVMETSECVLIGNEECIELSALRLPDDVLLSGADYRIGLHAKNAGGGTLALDYVQFIPMDVYRKVACSPMSGLAHGDIVTIDDILGNLNVVAETAAYSTRFANMYKRPILLMPGVDNSLWFVVNEYGGPPQPPDVYTPRFMRIDVAHKVRVYYRPRWLTI